MSRAGSRRSSSPLIVIGSSRSGTGLLARVLQANGVYVGADLESNAESKSIQLINKWIMHNGASTLEDPSGMEVLAHDRFLFAAVCASVARLYKRSAFAAGCPPTRPCAFKDPRSTFTLPVWLDLFPDARVIHVLRHGLDVVESLMARRRAVERRWLAGHAPDAEALLSQNRTVGNLIGTDAAVCFQHWRTYADAASGVVARLGPARAVTVRYEDMCAGRLPSALADLAGKRLAVRGVRLDVGRAFAHRSGGGQPVPAYWRGALARHGYDEKG